MLSPLCFLRRLKYVAFRHDVSPDATRASWRCISSFSKPFPVDRVRLRGFCLFGAYDRTWRHWNYVECWLRMANATWHPRSSAASLWFTNVTALLPRVCATFWSDTSGIDESLRIFSYTYMLYIIILTIIRK